MRNQKSQPKAGRPLDEKIKDPDSPAGRQKSKLFESVYMIVRKIPKGKVATYGQISKLTNSTSSRKVSARLVGRALHINPDPKKIPCHRVVNAKGKLAENYAFGGWKEQKRKLLSEGVKFRGNLYVDLESCLWNSF